jgi:hypothetical protein
VQGVCRPTCAAGYADVDGNPLNGCESTLPTGVGATSSLVLWLDGEKGFDPKAKPPIWSDQSGGGREAIQTGFPISVPPGWGKDPPTAGVLAGRQVVDFPGPHSEMMIPAGFPSFKGLTLFVVYKPISNDNYWLTLGTSINSTCDPFVGCTPYNFVGFASHQDATNDSMEFLVCSELQGTCLHSYFDGPGINVWTHYSMRETAADVTSGPYVGPPTNNPPNNTPMAIGGQPAKFLLASPGNVTFPLPLPTNASRTDTVLAYGGFVGQIAEVVLFDGALTDAQVATIDAYLTTKWGY